MFCASCGGKMPADARFCPACGVFVKTEADAKCESCQAAVKSGSRFCTGCGAALPQLAEVKPAVPTYLYMSLTAEDIVPKPEPLQKGWLYLFKMLLINSGTGIIRRLPLILLLFLVCMVLHSYLLVAFNKGIGAGTWIGVQILATQGGVVSAVLLWAMVTACIFGMISAIRKDGVAVFLLKAVNVPKSMVSHVFKAGSEGLMLLFTGLGLALIISGVLSGITNIVAAFAIAAVSVSPAGETIAVLIRTSWRNIMVALGPGHSSEASKYSLDHAHSAVVGAAAGFLLATVLPSPSLLGFLVLIIVAVMIYAKSTPDDDNPVNTTMGILFVAYFILAGKEVMAADPAGLANAGEALKAWLNRPQSGGIILYSIGPAIGAAFGPTLARGLAGINPADFRYDDETEESDNSWATYHVAGLSDIRDQRNETYTAPVNLSKEVAAAVFEGAGSFTAPLVINDGRSFEQPGRQAIISGETINDHGFKKDGQTGLEQMEAFADPYIDGFDQQGRDAQGYDRFGYDSSGFDRDGYDASGYDQDGFNRQGFDREGYNRSGWDKEGYDRLGYSAYGFDREGWDSEGYNRTGYDRMGFDRQDRDKDGYDRMGYDRTGWDREGYNREGYDNTGFNRSGWDNDGFNRQGYDIEGYDRQGLDRDGFNRQGFDQEGYNRQGYDAFGFDRSGWDAEGYDRTGLDREGYDHQGFDKQGFNRQGFDRDGFNKQGFDQEGFDRQGYDSTGFDRKGRDAEGYNRDGYDWAGFNRDGRDIEGYDRNGFDSDGFDREGFSREGRDMEGYDRNGFNLDGFNREGRNALGFNRDGYDIYGFDSNGYDKEGYDRNGFSASGLDREGYYRDGYDQYGFNRDGVNRNGKSIKAIQEEARRRVEHDTKAEWMSWGNNKPIDVLNNVSGPAGGRIKDIFIVTREEADGILDDAEESKLKSIFTRENPQWVVDSTMELSGSFRSDNLPIFKGRIIETSSQGSDEMSVRYIKETLFSIDNNSGPITERIKDASSEAKAIMSTGVSKEPIMDNSLPKKEVI